MVDISSVNYLYVPYDILSNNEYSEIENKPALQAARRPKQPPEQNTYEFWASAMMQLWCLEQFVMY